VYPWAAAPSREGRAEEINEGSLEDMGVFEDFEIS
jgi:hypothetical protein